MNHEARGRGGDPVHSKGKAHRPDALAETIPSAVTAVILFGLAGIIEASLSPSSAPYALKAGVAVLSCAIMVFYFVFLGYPRGEQPHAV